MISPWYKKLLDKDKYYPFFTLVENPNRILPESFKINYAGSCEIPKKCHIVLLRSYQITRVLAKFLQVLSGFFVGFSTQ